MYGLLDFSVVFDPRVTPPPLTLPARWRVSPNRKGRETEACTGTGEGDPALIRGRVDA